VRWEELSASGRGVRLHVRRVVEPAAPPVLLLHGLGVGASIWQGFARRLLPHLAAVAPDLRGHGLSDAPPQAYEPADYAGDLVELIDDLKLTTPVPVVGHSLGALVALALADVRPNLVKWLALLDPPLDPEQRNSEVPRVYELRKAARGELEHFLLERNPGGGQLMAEAMANLFRQASDTAFEAMLRPGRPMPPAPSVPCLIVQADPDFGGGLQDAAADTFVARLPQGKKVKVQGAAHALHASHPAEVARAILSFGDYQLRRLPVFVRVGFLSVRCPQLLA
jgi:pimeloyl-ACP methyl ester carboxylesterase